MLEAINNAADRVYGGAEDPPMDKSTFIQLMRLAVCNGCFISGGKWHVQNDAVAMGSSLAVILANLWLRFEPILAGETVECVPEVNQLPVDVNVCRVCVTWVTRRGYSIHCHWCTTWFHRKRANLSVAEIKEFVRAKSPWFCSCSRPSTSFVPTEFTIPRSYVFGRYVNDIIRTARKEAIHGILGSANSLHPSLEFTVEEENKGTIPFLDMLLRRPNFSNLLWLRHWRRNLWSARER